MKMLHCLTGLLGTSSNMDKTIWKHTTPFIPPIEGGICIQVTNPETLILAARLPYPESPCYRFDVRLNGISCPSINSKTEEEKSMAYLTKQTLEELVKMKQVQLKNVKTEKYGKLLADVYCEDIFINQYLLDQNLAVSDTGPKSWLKYYSKSSSSEDVRQSVSEPESSSKS